MDEIEKLIEKGDIDEAQKLLDGIKENSARKYFLQGKIFLAKNWFSEAYKQFKKAVKAEPNNAEYIAAVEDLENFKKTVEYEQYKKGQMGGAETCGFCCAEGCLTGICEGICDGF